MADKPGKPVDENDSNAAFEIRTARADEAADIAALILRAFESQCRLYDDWTIPPMNETAESVSEAMQVSPTLVAVIDGAIAGSVRAIVNDESVEIGRLVVEPSLQGSGIGRALVIAAEQACPQAIRFEIVTGHRSAPALHLYDSLGYSKYRQEPIQPGLDLIYLSKPGPAAT